MTHKHEWSPVDGTWRYAGRGRDNAKQDRQVLYCPSCPGRDYSWRPHQHTATARGAKCTSCGASLPKDQLR
jgi:hypothetical protein